MRDTFSLSKAKLHGHLSPGIISLTNMGLYIKLRQKKNQSLPFLRKRSVTKTRHLL
ncbi:unnamed protein product [Brassica oleracea]